MCATLQTWTAIQNLLYGLIKSNYENKFKRILANVNVNNKETETIKITKYGIKNHL